MAENWQEIADFPHYLVSDHGNVMLGTALSPRRLTINDRGYPIVTLYGKDSKTRYLRQVNTLVANAFLPRPLFEEMNNIWHIDGNFENCHYSNLKWETRPRVLEWNEMLRRGRPAYPTPRVKNNRTGAVYDSAYACALAEGELESVIVFKIERQAENMESEVARYRYLFGGDT